jgi:hypothetical protein
LRERLSAGEFRGQTYIPLYAYYRTLLLERSRGFLKKAEIFEEKNAPGKKATGACMFRQPRPMSV